MSHRIIRSLVATLLLALPLTALADSYTEGSDTITGEQSTATFGSDNVVGTLTSGGVGISGATIKIYDPDGNLVGSGTTGSKGEYDIDTNMQSVGGWTLTFEVTWGAHGSGGFSKNPELTMKNLVDRGTPSTGKGGDKGK